MLFFSLVIFILLPTEHFFDVLKSMKVKVFVIQLNPWTVAHQVPLSLKFFRQESWSGLPFPSPGDLSDPGIEPGSPILQAEFILSEQPGNIFFFSPFFTICGLNQVQQFLKHNFIVKTLFFSKIIYNYFKCLDIYFIHKT